MDPVALFVALASLLGLALCWFGFHYLGNKPLADPDGIATVTGNCGDTMELSLKFREGKVCEARAWTNGCSVSRNCVEAAALLARNRSLEELAKITMITIMEEVGQLPETHLHCAQLAETTLCLAAQSAREKRGPIVVSGR